MYALRMLYNISLHKFEIYQYRYRSNFIWQHDILYNSVGTLGSLATNYTLISMINTHRRGDDISIIFICTHICKALTSHLTSDGQVLHSLYSKSMCMSYTYGAFCFKLDMKFIHIPR